MSCWYDWWQCQLPAAELYYRFFDHPSGNFRPQVFFVACGFRHLYVHLRLVVSPVVSACKQACGFRAAPMFPRTFPFYYSIICAMLLGLLPRTRHMGTYMLMCTCTNFAWHWLVTTSSVPICLGPVLGACFFSRSWVLRKELKLTS